MTGSPSIIIIGCGFGGVGLGIALKKAGCENFTIFEKASEIGGVWRDNTYPGATCDVPSRFYSYSFEQDFPWRTRYAGQSQIHDYLRHCVEKYRLGPHIRTETEITAAVFDEAAGTWRVTTAAGDIHEANLLVSAMGLFNRPLVPDLPGQDAFRGPRFHSARWDHSVSLAGKTVAVIGTGASAIQFVPAIAAEAGRMYVFQRSAQYVMPKVDGALDTTGGLRTWLESRVERARTYVTFERASRGRGSPRLTAKGEAGFRALLAARVADPELRRKLTPDYPLGCKRVLRSDDWYPAIQRENVTLIDQPVTEIFETGVATAERRYDDVDVIIYGTGFRTTEYLTPVTITGPGGRDLNAHWAGHPEAYLGMTVAGFPNFFMMYGPNTNLLGSIIYLLERQARYITRAAGMLAGKPGRTIDVRPEIQNRYNAGIQARIGKTVLVAEGCHSYFQAADGTIVTQWPGFMGEYAWATRRVRRGDFVWSG